MSEERTERATPKRRSDARKKGDVPRSQELTSAIALLAAIALLRWQGTNAISAISTQMQLLFSSLSGSDLTPLAVQSLGWESGMVFARALGPLVGVIITVSIASNVAQSGPVFSLTAIKPDFNRINPGRGLKRIFSKRGLFESGKAMAKLAIIAGLTYPVLREQISRFAALTGADPGTIGGAIGSTLSAVAFRAAGAFFILALIDYGYQRWDYERRIRMTRQELREEMRQTDGNPELKSRIRQLQRQLGQGRMMAEVPNATVVVTNPTHLAVAIRYEAEGMAAPVVVAKGSGMMAERIKEVARKHAVPVIENKPVAQALFKTAVVGKEIPIALYEMVADVIAYVYRLRGRREWGTN